MTPLPVEVESLLGLLHDVQATGLNSWKACCPGHPDSDPSLAITWVGDKILVYDFGNRCSPDAIMTAVGKTVADLFIRSTGASSGPLTLATFAEAKGFPIDFLERRGISEDQHGLVLAYHHIDGTLALRHRRRTTLRAKDGSTWTGKKGDPLVPYGLPCLELARTTGHLICTEGETNQLSAIFHAMPAIGIPGAQQTKLLTAAMLADITHLWITQDPDDAGAAFVQGMARRLGELEWGGEAKVVRMPTGIKDLNDLHRLAGERFAEEWARCCDQAEPVAISPPDRRPMIVMGTLGLTEMAREVWAAVEAKNEPVPSLFKFGTTLAWVTTDDDNTSVEVLGRDHVADHIDRVVRFVEIRGRDLKLVFPPGALARNMMTVRSRRLPRLTRIVRTPVFTADGRLLTTPGYDPASRIYLAPLADLTIPEIAATPTAADIQEAKRWLLDELLGDIPFVEDADRAHALALLLTSVLRELIPGNVPMFALDKPLPRSGATLTVQVLYLVIDGGDLEAMTAPNDKAEMRKRLTAALESGPALLLLDNVHGRLDSDALASILTTGRWSDRRLGYTEKITIPVRGVIAVTGNNLQMSNELAGRSVLIRIDPRTARPWERTGFRHADIKGWTRQHRGELLWAALTLGQAWIAAGQTRVERAFGGFEGWTAVVGGVLQVAGVPGFMANQARLFATMDEESAVLHVFVTQWWHKRGGERASVGQLYDIAKTIDGLDIQAPTEQGSRSRLGRLLTSLRDRAFRIDVQGETLEVTVRWAGSHANANWWRLERSGLPSGPLEAEGNPEVTRKVTEVSAEKDRPNEARVTFFTFSPDPTRAREGTPSQEGMPAENLSPEEGKKVKKVTRIPLLASPPPPGPPTVSSGSDL